MFSQLEDEKLLSRIFDGTEICKMICENDSMGSSMTIAVWKAWMLFVEVVKNFSGKENSERGPCPFLKIKNLILEKKVLIASILMLNLVSKM